MGKEAPKIPQLWWVPGIVSSESDRIEERDDIHEFREYSCKWELEKELKELIKNKLAESINNTCEI